MPRNPRHKGRQVKATGALNHPVKRNAQAGRGPLCRRRRTYTFPSPDVLSREVAGHREYPFPKNTGRIATGIPQLTQLDLTPFIRLPLLCLPNTFNRRFVATAQFSGSLNSLRLRRQYITRPLRVRLSNRIVTLLAALDKIPVISHLIPHYDNFAARGLA